MNNKLFIISIALLIGIVISQYIAIPFFVCLLSIAMILIVYIFNKKVNVKTYLIYALALLIGLATYSMASGQVSVLNANIGKVVSIEVTVKDDGKKGEYNYRYIVQINKKSEKMFIYTKTDSLDYGDKVMVSGMLEAIRPKSNPNTFDFAKYYKSKNMYNSMKPYKTEVLARDSIVGIEKLAYNIKNKTKNIIYSSMPSNEAGILYGILTGDKSDMDEDIKTAYMEAGIAHILAVSGLHIGFIYAMLEFIFAFIIKNKKVRSIIIAILLLSYVFIIGASISSIRAIIMVYVILIARCYRKDYNFISSISVAMILILLVKPLSIHDSGFVISFACVYSIALLSEPLLLLLRKLPSIIRTTLTTTIAIQLGTIPITVSNFNYFSPISILLNILVIPLAFIILALGFLGILISIISGVIAQAIFATDYYIISILTTLVRLSVSIIPPIVVPTPTLLIIIAYYSIIVFAFLYKSKYIAYIIGLCISITLVIALLPIEDSRVTYLDVGQGDATLIQTNENTNIIIDSGPRDITDLILKQGISQMDIIILSHFHADHATGAIGLLENIKVKQVIVTACSQKSKEKEKIEELCKEKNVKLNYVSAGDTIIVDKKFKIEIFSPSSGKIEKDDNLTSLLFGVSYKELDMLFTGDINKDVEIMNLQKLKKYEIIKIAHHGSRYSTSQEFLNKVNSDIAIIHVGKNNYGHPSGEVLKRLEESSVAIYRTDQDGAIIINIRGDKVRLKKMLGR